jgi:hypothetical protein
LLRIDAKEGDSYYDLVQGKEILPTKHHQKIVLSGKLSPRGIGCIIAGKPQALGSDFHSFIASQAEINQASGSKTDFPEIQAVRVPVVLTRKYEKPLVGMVKIPAFKGSLEVVFTVREVGFYSSIDPSFVNIGSPALHHQTSFSLEVNLPEFLIDETPVTNLQYHHFLKKSGYIPGETLNFLKHWKDGKIPSGKEDHPVVYVDLNDARAYALWAGKRLPTEYEWQFAGQGFEKNNYPWGQNMEEEFCNSGETEDTTAVKAYPNGKSVFGCYDMVGNTWELTESEHGDGRNRFCILKGGSFYKALYCDWYFDGYLKPLNFAAKQLLIYSGIDRCATVGFRCTADI